MEEAHRNHKEVTWGWLAVVIALLDGFPRRRIRASAKRGGSIGVVTPWSRRSPNGWSA